MELKDILAISGQPGLFKFIAQSKNGIIVESLLDGRRSNASGSSKVSALAEISVYTDQGDISLSEILTAIFEKNGGQNIIGAKSSPDDLKKFFAENIPNYDRDMVHVSDMKKIVSWYNTLVNAGMTDFTVEREEETADDTPSEPAADTE